MVNSLLTAIVRADGDALVMHVGERPYVVASSGPVELSSRPLTLDAVVGMLTQLLTADVRRVLDEFGAVEHELPQSTAAQGDKFTVVAARGGDDVWIEVRRHRRPKAAARSLAPSHAVPAVGSLAAATAPASGVAVSSAGPAAVVSGIPLPELPLDALTYSPVEAPPERIVADITPVTPQPEMLPPAPAPIASAPAQIPPEPVPGVTQPATRDAVPPAEEAVRPTAEVPPDVVEEATSAGRERAATTQSAPVSEAPAAPAPVRPLQEPGQYAREAVMEPIVRPLAASPIIERPAAPPREPLPQVVLPLGRHAGFTRPEPQPRPMPSPRPGGVERLLRLAVARGANVLYLASQARPSVRVDGDIALLEGEPPLGAQEVQALLLDLAPERVRGAIEAGASTEWMSDVPEAGRFRCQSFSDHRGPGAIFRMISARPTTAEQLGLSREIQALCAEPEGLVLIAGPRASGKSTLISALVDLVNRTRNDYVITIESQITVPQESRGCLVSQREVRGGNDEVAAVLRAALRENPDVLVIEDMRSPEVVHLALEATEAGQLVIGGVAAHGAAAAIDKILSQFPEARREQAQLALAEGLRGVVSQVLLRKASGGRVAARELLLNMPSIAALIAEGRVAQLPLAIDSGRKYGMVPLNDALAAFVQNGVVDVKEAYGKAFERQAFLAVLRREGMDTSFVDRLQ